MQTNTTGDLDHYCHVCYDEHEENGNDDDINSEELHNCLDISYTTQGRVTSHIFYFRLRNSDDLVFN